MKQFKPTSPARRQFQVADFSSLTARRPFKPLIRGRKQTSGRSSSGRITTRHKGGGAKQLYRLIEFGEQHLGQRGIVETIEYDPNRTAYIALIRWQDGSRSYILAPQGLAVGRTIQIGVETSLEIGNRLQLRNIPVGTPVHNIEVKPGGKAGFGRAAGTYCEVLAHEGNFTNLRMPSGEVRRVPSVGFASIGQLSKAEHALLSLGKAGRSRWLGVRPTVRGSAMNPRDHPYGGGEGRAIRGTKRPKTKWGKVTGGRKTRKRKKWSNKLILQRRSKSR
jgi:large subunit ribosomal protein L2